MWREETAGGLAVGSQIGNASGAKPDIAAFTACANAVMSGVGRTFTARTKSTSVTCEVARRPVCITGKGAEPWN